MPLVRPTHFISLLLGSFFVACAVPSAPESGTSRAPIVNGEASPADEDAVVLLLTHLASRDSDAGKSYLTCTGTLLAPNLVLTARHCVSAMSEGSFTCSHTGQVTVGAGGAVTGELATTDIHVYAGQKLPSPINPEAFPGKPTSIIHDAAKVLCNADVALLVLAEPIADASIAPVRLDAPVTPDEELVVVGWGATVKTSIPTSRQHRTGVHVTHIGPDTHQYGAGELGDKEFIASESVCTGDSGGPAFDSATHAVVGVVSHGPNGNVTTNGSGCVGTEHVFMQTASFKDLILQGYAAAGVTPWREGEASPGASSVPDGGTAKEAGVSTNASIPAEESSGCATRGRSGVSPVGFWFLAGGLFFFRCLRRRK